jgi:hypothetical protein
MSSVQVNVTNTATHTVTRDAQKHPVMFLTLFLFLGAATLLMVSIVLIYVALGIMGDISLFRTLTMLALGVVSAGVFLNAMRLMRKEVFKLIRRPFTK